jgi:hypothetical protein
LISCTVAKLNKESCTNHLVDELELILSLLDELLYLSASDYVLNVIPVILLLADLEYVVGEGLDGLAVALEDWRMTSVTSHPLKRWSVLTRIHTRCQHRSINA